MTTQTYVANSIMALVGVDSGVVGVSGLTVMPVWEGSYVYFLQTSDLYGPGIRKLYIDDPGTEALQVTKATLGLASISASSGGAAAVSYDGTQLVFVCDTGNSVKLAEINAATLTLTGTFGTSNSSVGPSTTTNIIAPQVMTVQNQGGLPVLLCASAAAAEEIDSLPISGFAPNTKLGNLTQQVAFGGFVSHGPILATGNAYALGLPFQNGTVTAHNSDPIGVYKITSGGAITSLGTFKFSDIDGAWTRIFNCFGVAYDETDGNLIAAVQTDESVTHKQYIIKISGTTGAVLWTCVVNAISPFAWSYTNSRIRNQKFHMIGTASTIYHIDTNAGTATTETSFGTIDATGPQVSDDVTNSIIAFGDYIAPMSSPPNYIGTYMLTNGHHTLSSQWYRIWFATAGGGGGGNGGNEGGLAISKRRAWTYTMDGHTFYVLELQSEGTWVYDVGTKEWAHFYTGGGGQWNMQNGVQWGIRVVAGDLTTTDVWELTPTALTDNAGASQIQHVVTGGIQVRTREKRGVGALRVTASLGNLGNTAGSAMVLRFSDDQAKTWSSNFTVSLTQADYESEIAYRSLGSFNLPGRIFELSDVGGPVRIDGCDAEIEGIPDGAPTG